MEVGGRMWEEKGEKSGYGGGKKGRKREMEGEIQDREVEESVWEEVDGGKNQDFSQTCDFENECHHWSMRGFQVINGNNLKEKKYLGIKFKETDYRGKFSLLSTFEGENIGSITSDWYSSGNKNYTLTFSSIVYGASSNTNLTVAIRAQNYSEDIYKISAEIDSGWTIHHVLVGGLSHPFSVQFIGQLQDKGCYIAVDNVSVVIQEEKDGPTHDACYLSEHDCGNGTCVSKCDCDEQNKDKKDKCGNLESISVCTFENGLCGWHNVDGDDFDWTLHSGSTLTEETGPSFDHTTGNGHYLYIETSGHFLKRAILESSRLPPVPANRTCKLRFYYHMYGHYIERLSLDILEDVCHKSMMPHMIWNVTRKDKDIWEYTEVHIPHINQSYILQFVGTTGLKSEGDIAIDDVSFTEECFGLGTDEEVSHDSRMETHKKCSKVQGSTTKPPAHVTSEGVPFEVNLTDSKNIDTSESSPTKNNSTGSRKHTVFNFETCGAIGKEGPTQSSCDLAYEGTNVVNVQVAVEGQWKGVQVWTIPQNGTYLIWAFGAAGGTGARPAGKSNGGSAGGKFNLTEGEKLYIVVGQKGHDACTASLSSERVKQLCAQGLPFVSIENEFKHAGGGGGGGGASFVAKMDQGIQQLVPLVIGGGGGGLAFRKGNTTSHGGSTLIGPGVNGETNPDGAGGGGGWNGTTNYTQAGKSFLEGGAVGGDSCVRAIQEFKWNSPGGFGGGGGACSSGGGGGGYTGGNASSVDSMDGIGQGGSSYVHPDAFDETYNPNIHTGGDGFVEIEVDLLCPCEFMCIIYNWEKGNYTCECPGGKTLSEDLHTCVTVSLLKATELTPLLKATDLPVNPKLEPHVGGLELGYIVAIAISVTLMFITVGGILICLVQQHKRKKYLESVRMEMASTSQTYTMRTATANGNLPSISVRTNRMMAEYNPNYDFVGAKYPEQQLTEINRNKLRLVRALGQGAFGDVYKGYLAGVPHVEGELPVAIKTLPTYTTEQAEMDFLMEAVIMSKFCHPNIVKFLGVCFEDHPRYIILELLEGGDIKTFLREMRPKAENIPCALCVSDLLKLAVDIAKGCQHLEEHHFIHRDIAARNCLLTCKGPGRIAKIADFGMSRDIYRQDYYKKGGKALLPIKWMPPEAFLDGVFTSKTDVWSYGILLWEIFSMGYMPYPGITNHDVMHFVTTGGRLEGPDKCPSAVYQLMSICWAAIPETRPTFAEIIEQLDRCLQMPEVLNAQLPVSCKITNMDKAVLRQQQNSDIISALPVVLEEDDLCGNVHDSNSDDPLILREGDKDFKGEVKKEKDSLDFPALVVQLTPELCSKSSSNRTSPSSFCNPSLSTSSSFNSSLLVPVLQDVSTQCCDNSSNKKIPKCTSSLTRANSPLLNLKSEEELA